MSIKTWQERIDANYPNPTRAPEIVQHYMQAEIDDTRAERDEYIRCYNVLTSDVTKAQKELQTRDASTLFFTSRARALAREVLANETTGAAQRKEIEQLTETSIWQAGRISELLDDAAAQRKVLEQALEALQSLFSFEVDEHRGERCASAITAIQEQLK